MSQEPKPPRSKRIPVMLGLVALGGALIGFMLWERSQAGVTTDDAFLRADLVQVPAEVGGKVVEVGVDDDQPVTKGQLLLRIDDTDYQLRVAQAEAALAGAQADARRAEDTAAASRAELKVGQVRLTDAQREQRLQEQLTAGGASVPAAVDRATAAVDIASTSIQSAKVGLTAVESAVEAARTRITAAEAALTMARRDLDLCTVTAPTDGIAARMELEPGELVQRGQPILAIVPHGRYVVANFKETDLARIHVGDSVDIAVDAFPRADLHGAVTSIGPGTGAVFSMLPTDNATGNFIKVVQRVPVRISVEGDEVATMPAGLSANVTVHVSQP